MDSSQNKKITACTAYRTCLISNTVAHFLFSTLTAFSNRALAHPLGDVSPAIIVFTVRFWLKSEKNSQIKVTADTRNQGIPSSQLSMSRASPSLVHLAFNSGTERAFLSSLKPLNMPVVKHVTKRQKKRKKSQSGTEANKKDKNKNAGEQKACAAISFAQQNPTPNGFWCKVSATNYFFLVVPSTRFSPTRISFLLTPCISSFFAGSRRRRRRCSGGEASDQVANPIER